MKLISDFTLETRQLYKGEQLRYNKHDNRVMTLNLMEETKIKKLKY